MQLILHFFRMLDFCYNYKWTGPAKLFILKFHFRTALCNIKHSSCRNIQLDVCCHSTFTECLAAHLQAHGGGPTYTEFIKSSQLLQEEEINPKLSFSLSPKKIFTWTKNKQTPNENKQATKTKSQQHHHKIPALPTGR